MWQKGIRNPEVLFMRRGARSCLEYLSVCLRGPESQETQSVQKIGRKLITTNIKEIIRQIVFAYHSDADLIILGTAEERAAFI